ncbi:MAG: AAA family ATPase [Cetobacterium sp.]|uniref:AAA family ATPase n=1 Tax=Cetobacterium sp. TaxID=2071632 RepID=UPI003F2FD636
MRVGCVIGKFYPFHNGHAFMIEEAAKHVDKLYVLACFTDGETIPIGIREEWLQTFVNCNQVELEGYGCKTIIVDKVIDQLPSSSDGRTSDFKVSEVWAKYLKNRFPDITHFIGSEPYIEMMASSIGADAVLVDVDRKKFPISATKVRNSFKNSYDLIPSYVKSSYIPRVCIVGIESSGKSTLTKDLEDAMKNIVSVEEYGRTYCLVNSPLDDMKDYFLTRQDFRNIAIGHNRLVLHAYKYACKSNKKLVIVDTDHIVTQAFFKRYIDPKGDDYIRNMINFQEYDLFLWVDQVNFEDDGTRRIVSSSERKSQAVQLMTDLKEKAHDKVKIVSGNSREERLKSAIRIMDDYLPGDIFTNVKDYLK